MRGLSERVSGLRISGADGAAVLPEMRGEGAFAFVFTGAATIRYEMRLARAYDPGQHALVSSLGPEAAVLMAADLLPRVCPGESNCEGPARLRIAPPAGWTVATGETRDGEDFAIADPSRAVFVLGALRERQAKLGDMILRTAVAGSWSLGDDDIATLIEAIAREQSAMVGGREAGAFLVTLAPYPQPMTGLRSSAVTIGRTVVLLLNEAGSPPRATLAHYRRHLAHEMFHFYLPNAFRIREHFDWFWEGFTRYAALLTLQRLRLATRRECLDAVAEEYDAYASNPLRARVSLLAASPDKFSGAAFSDLVYRKGMLVAALYDWELRWQSRGRADLTDVLRGLYALREREIGNREVLDALRRAGEVAARVRDDIEDARDIELAKRIKPYGLVLEQSAATNWKPRLNPVPKPSDRQREWLAHLGANP
jgi:predicted metalloprotease with PDZ domain